MKPFKGVIKDWSVYDDCVQGVCVHHTTYERSITQNECIITSVVISINSIPGSCAMQLETKNSIYILI